MMFRVGDLIRPIDVPRESQLWTAQFRETFLVVIAADSDNFRVAIFSRGKCGMRTMVAMNQNRWFQLIQRSRP